MVKRLEIFGTLVQIAFLLCFVRNVSAEEVVDQKPTETNAATEKKNKEDLNEQSTDTKEAEAADEKLLEDVRSMGMKEADSAPLVNSNTFDFGINFQEISEGIHPRSVRVVARHSNVSASDLSYGLSQQQIELGLGGPAIALSNHGSHDFLVKDVHHFGSGKVKLFFSAEVTNFSVSLDVMPERKNYLEYQPMIAGGVNLKFYGCNFTNVARAGVSVGNLGDEFGKWAAGFGSYLVCDRIKAVGETLWLRHDGTTDNSRSALFSVAVTPTRAVTFRVDHLSLRHESEPILNGAVGDHAETNTYFTYGGAW